MLGFDTGPGGGELDHAARDRPRRRRRLPARAEPVGARPAARRSTSARWRDERPLEPVLRVQPERHVTRRRPLDGGLPQGVRADLPDHARRPGGERAPARARSCRSSATTIPANPLVQVVWNPQGYGSPDLPGNSAQAYYPGDKYVDMVGDDLYDIRGKAEWPAAERLYQRAPVEAVRVPRMGPLGHRRPVVRATDGEVRADAPADEADRVLQREAWLDLRPRVEAAIARRLQAVHRAARGERQPPAETYEPVPALRAAPPAPRRAARAGRGTASS